MADFLFIYRGDGKAESRMSPEEMQQHMNKWGAWIRQAMAEGWMTNPGDALTPEGKVVYFTLSFGADPDDAESPL